ncbi:MAG: hypothetical protein DRQ55_07630 [Planctomycetota bacterium]|nr:MAG: hypothetical protein DRQ55_07630 [Planctomycetota bacterium]
MPRVHFRKENVTVHVPEGANLRQLCVDYDIDPYPALGGLLSCRGKGLCGTCAVELEQADEGAASSPEKREAAYLKRQSEGLRQRLRLSCCVTVQGDMTVVTDPDRRESWKRHGHYAGRPVRSWSQPA